MTSAGYKLYEISARAWLYELAGSSPGGKAEGLAAVPDAELKRIKDGGADMVWLQGVWQLGPFGLALDRSEKSRMGGYQKALQDFTEDDIIGSPYAVTVYSVMDELGGDDGMIAFRDRLKSFGLKLMLDFVPNHLAVDCEWASDPDKKNFFVRAKDDKAMDGYHKDGTAMGKDPYTGAWPDTAQLNYWNPELRDAQTDVLTKIASMCDGIRIDMAMLLINHVVEQTWGREMAETGWKMPETEFWTEAIKTVRKKFPDVSLMAEVYWELDAELFRQGFNYTYDKVLYDILVSGHMDNLRNYISSKDQTFMSHSAHFVENHDEPRAAVEFGGRTRANCAAALSFLLPGIRLQFHGQWEGKKARLDVHLRRCEEEETVSSTVAFFSNLNRVISDPVFHEGAWTFRPVGWVDGDHDPWRIVSWSWSLGEERRAVVINYTDGDASVHVSLPDAPSGETTIEELMTQESYERDGSAIKTTGLHCVLPPWAVQVFKY